jgi:hypothetical protein
MLDTSHAATPATDDLRNALMILAPTVGEGAMIPDAVARLIRSALAKLEAGK